MAEVRIGQRDVDSLGRKLGQLEPELTEPERVLLRYMLSVAADAINTSAEQAPADLPDSVDPEPDAVTMVVDPAAEAALSIRDQFAAAFTPGSVSRAKITPASVGPGPGVAAHRPLPHRPPDPHG